MLDVSTLSVFCLTVFVLLITPGPEMLYVIARSAEQGRTTGIVSVLGVCAGDLVHIFAAAVGLSALLMTSALAYTLVKYAGAAYMIYLGVRIFLSRENQVKPGASRQASLVTTFAQAALSSVLNPKVALFFLAFLPQFINPALGLVVLQIITLGAVWVSMTLLGYTLVALVAGTVSHWLRNHSGFARFQKWFTGSILVVLGVRLVLSKRI